MNIQKIVCKATMPEEIRYKKTLGVDGVEWQILDKQNNYFVNYLGMPIYSVHTKLGQGIDVCVDNITENFSHSKEMTAFTKDEIEKTFKLCEDLSQRQGFPVKMVVHMKSGTFMEKRVLEEYYGPLFKEYPSVDLCIENVMLTTRGEVRSGVLPDNVPNFIKYFREVFNGEYDNRIHSVLDICHATSVIRMLNSLYGQDKQYKEDEEIELYFKKFADTCAIVHFNFLRDFGLEPNHGTSMTDAEFKMCYGTYLKYTPEAELVIEMREYNYHDCINLRKTVKQIRGYTP